MNNQLLIDEQKRLEAEMRGVTTKRYHSLHEKASDRGEFSDTHSGKKLLEHSLQSFEAGIYAWVAEAESGKAGRKPSALRLVKDFDDIPTLAYLYTKAILNTVPLLETRMGTASRTSVVLSAIQTVHDELRLRWFSNNNKRLLKQMIKDFDKRDVGRRRRRDLVKRAFNQRKLTWEAEGWTEQNRINLGVKLLEIFRDTTGYVTLANIRTKNGKSRSIVQATELIVKTLSDRMVNAENMFTVYFPMVIKPVKWSPNNIIGGGYITQDVAPYKLVKSSKISYLNDLANVEMSKTYDAINAIQETPFRVNKTMVDIIDWAYTQNTGIGDLPISENDCIPAPPHNIDEDKEVLKEYKKACYKVHDKNRRSISARGAILRTIHLANKFSKYDIIYFPHDLDSRGRIYPKPSYLNPQGTGYVKSLLEFGEGKALNDGKDVAFIAITGANAFGEDKISLQERVDWVFDNEEMILSVASDPKVDQRWTQADSPFEFLRFCLEWKGINEQGVGYISHLPCPVDATCSGLQHFSAMLRDRVGGFAVNLTECDERQDIYQLVADKTTAMVTADLKSTAKQGKEPEEGDDIRPSIALLAQVALDLGINRKTTKRSVMVVPYSGTFSACMSYTEEHFVERFEKGEVCPLDEKIFVRYFIPYISKRIWSSIDKTVVAARDTMNWMKDIAKLACTSEDPTPIQWTTPTGFIVQQAKYKTLEHKYKTYLDGKQIRLSVRQDKPQLDPSKNASSLSPNYIHSQDAAHLMLTVCKSLDTDKNMSFAMVHDSFACHASDMKVFLDDCISPAFYGMYKDGENLKRFLEEMKMNIDPNAEIPPLPVMGDLDLEEVLYSDFFFS